MMRSLCLFLLSAFTILVEASIRDDAITLPTATFDKVQFSQDFTDQISGIHSNVTWAIVPFRKQAVSSDVVIILEVTNRDGDITVYTAENTICDPTSETGHSNTKYVHALYKGDTNMLYFCIHKRTTEPQNLNTDRFLFYFDAIQEVEYGEVVEVICTQQESDKTRNHVMYMITKMPAPESSPSVDVVLNSWLDNLDVHVSVNVPPVGKDFEYTSFGDSTTETKSYIVTIEKDLDTNDVVYTKINCPIDFYAGEPLSYTYSMVVGAAFVVVLAALIIIMVIGNVVNKPFKKDVEEQDMLRIRYFPLISLVVVVMGVIVLIVGVVLLILLGTIIIGAPIMGGGLLLILFGLIFTGPSVFVLNKSTDEFIIIKHYLVTLPHRKVLKLSEVDKFEFGLSANRRGVVSYTMCVVKKSGYSIPLEMAASNISMSKRENMLKQFNNFLSSAAPAVSYTQETPY